MAWHLPPAVRICEVGPRDGLQMEPRVLQTTEKVRLIEALAECGFEKVEAASFVRPDLLPQMAGAAEVMAAVARRPPTRYVGLVPNLRGCERALAAGVDEVNVTVAASETFNRQNVRMSTSRSMDELRRIVQAAAGRGVPVWVSISTAFGCPFEGDVDPDRVLEIASGALSAGAAGVTLADTTGMAHPLQVSALVRQAARVAGAARLALHFHDTRGMGLANVLAALDAGAARFDASVGGIGGCPFAPGASGNVCTEDLVHMLEAIGVETGVDLDRLVAIARDLEVTLGHPLPGQVMKAGRRARRYAVPGGPGSLSQARGPGPS